MRFEWDSGKNAANWPKHEVEFEAAARVFDDGDYVLLKDRIVGGEQRWHAIGQVLIDEVSGGSGSLLLLVVHVCREANNGEEIIRIISARRADKRERRIYRDKAVE